MVSLDELIQRMESAAPATSAFAAALEFAGKTFLEAMMAKVSLNAPVALYFILPVQDYSSCCNRVPPLV